MTIQVVLLPLFAEVILTFALLFSLAPLRARDFNTGVTRPENIALREPNWSKRTLQIGYSFSNQFELPVLFYVLTILAYFTHRAGVLFVVLAWIFVLFRYLQAYVHVTSNKVRLRGSFFIVSALALAIMWVVYIVEILTSPWV
ncbi:MAG TPA: MAPEG family protein [Xanthobacteraceae bacterium]|nr:MAPEG family protein [Xanthobacteraceae bacterium]